MADENIKVVQEPEGTSEPAQRTYTEADLKSYTSKAVNEALTKAKERLMKSSDERVAELEKELNELKAKNYCSSKLSELGLPVELASFCISSTDEECDTKIASLSKALDDIVKSRVEQTLKTSKPAVFHSDAPASSKGIRSLAQIAAEQKG